MLRVGVSAHQCTWCCTVHVMSTSASDAEKCTWCRTVHVMPTGARYAKEYMYVMPNSTCDAEQCTWYQPVKVIPTSAHDTNQCTWYQPVHAMLHIACDANHCTNLSETEWHPKEVYHVNWENFNKLYNKKQIDFFYDNCFYLRVFSTIGIREQLNGLIRVQKTIAYHRFICKFESDCETK